MPGQLASLVLLLRQPAAEDHHRLRYFFMRAADGMALDQRGRGLAESAGVHLLRDRADPAVIVELDGDGDAAAAGRRAQLGPAVLPLELERLVERGREPQDLGRVERAVIPGAM